MSSSNEHSAVGVRLKRVRERHGLSQEAMAASLGVSLRGWQNYERGQRAASDVLIRALWSTYGIDPVWLLTGEGKMQRREEGTTARDQDGAADQTQAQGSAEWSRRLEALAVLLEGLQPEHREAILADALSRASSAQQLAELGQALADLRESLKSGAA